MKTIGVFFGSRSPEHDISIITAMRVMEGFEELKEYHAVPIYINKNGEWFSGQELGKIEFFRDPQCEQKLEPFAISSFSFANGAIFLHSGRKGFLRKKNPICVELAFPCFHGPFGEDGTIQGLFEIGHIPYVGCPVLASALTMSKIHTRRLLAALGIPSVPTIEVPKEEFAQDRARFVAQLAKSFPYPLFVKPNALGSSIAVSCVENNKELEWALEVVFHFDTLALVERAVPHVKEVNVAVIGHRKLFISETEEPRFRDTFQTFEAKYIIKGGSITQSKGKATSAIPADVPPATSSALKDAAVRSFRALGASGIARFDFFVNKENCGEWYLAEVNTLPGTLQAHLFAASGIPLPDLIKRLIRYAEDRYQEENSLFRVFPSSILKE